MLINNDHFKLNLIKFGIFISAPNVERQSRGECDPGQIRHHQIGGCFIDWIKFPNASGNVGRHQTYFSSGL